MKKKKIRIKNLFEPTNGIFKNMSYVFPNITNEDIDILFLTNYGDRIISPLVELFVDDTEQIPENQVIRLSGIIQSKYAAMWDRRKRVLETEYELDASDTKIVTEVTEDENEHGLYSKSEENEKAKIYGFGGTDAADDNERNSLKEKTDGSSSKGSKTRIYTQKGNSVPIQSVLGSELKMSQWDFIQQVLKDVANETTLQIY